MYAYIYSSPRTAKLAASNSYTTSAYLIAIPKGELLSPLERILKPFRHKIWIYFGLTLLSGITLIYSIRLVGKSKLMEFIYGHRNRIPITNLLSTLFGGPLFVSSLPYRNFARYILTVWMLYTFVLRTAYSGKLYHILHDGDSHNTMKTLNDIIKYNFTIFATPVLSKIVQGILPKANVIGLTEAENTHELILLRISDTESNEKISLCTLDFTIKYYNQLHPTRRVDLLEEIVINSPLVFHTSRHSYFIQRMNDLVLDFVAVGVMKRLRKIAVYAPLKAPRHYSEPIQFSFDALVGAFYIYGILDAEGNITVHAYIYNSKRSAILTASDSYHTTTFYMALPLGQPLSPFERLIKPLHYVVWICFSSSVLFAISFLYSIRYLGKSHVLDFILGRGNRIPVTNLFSTLYGGAISTDGPFRNFARYILTLWMMYTFWLRAAYSCELFTILQDGKSHNHMKTLAEVAKNNYTIYAFGTLADVIRNVLPEGRIVKLADREHKQEELFARISDPSGIEKIGLCSLDFIIQYYNQKHSKRRVKKLAQSVNTSPVVFYMTRHSYLQSKTSDLILQMVAAGLMKRLRSLAIYAVVSEPRVNKEPISLSLDILLGIFIVYGIFIALCFFVFLLEMVSGKFRWAKIVIDFFNF